MSESFYSTFNVHNVEHKSRESHLKATELCCRRILIPQLRLHLFLTFTLLRSRLDSLSATSSPFSIDFSRTSSTRQLILSRAIFLLHVESMWWKVSFKNMFRITKFNENVRSCVTAFVFCVEGTITNSDDEHYWVWQRKLRTFITKKYEKT